MRNNQARRERVASILAGLPPDSGVMPATDLDERSKTTAPSPEAAEGEPGRLNHTTAKAAR